MGSTTGNAYRASLLDSLTTAGATIDYTGTIQSGSMDDNDNEGRIGWTIEQISGAATDASSAGVEADVVLLHAGTNDATTYGWEEAHVRLGELIETVTGLWPEAKVLVAKIVPSAAQDTQEHIEFFNERVQGMGWSFLSKSLAESPVEIMELTLNSQVLSMSRLMTNSASSIWAVLLILILIWMMLFTPTIRGMRRWLLCGLKA